VLAARHLRGPSRCPASSAFTARPTAFASARLRSGAGAARGVRPQGHWSMGLPVRGEHRHDLARPMVMSALQQMLREVGLGPSIDMLVVDMPPRTGDAPADARPAGPRYAGAVIVSTPRDLALIDCPPRHRGCFARLNVRLIGIGRGHELLFSARPAARAMRSSAMAAPAAEADKLETLPFLGEVLLRTRSCASDPDCPVVTGPVCRRPDFGAFRHLSATWRPGTGMLRVRSRGGAAACSPNSLSR
jgi:hypothetical protein